MIHSAKNQHLLNIVFYDGECGFCNRTVQFILKHERNQQILFSSLQSDFSKDFFKENNFPTPDLSTFYFFTEGVLLQKSTGGLKVLGFLKWYLQFARIAWVLPICWRDRIYSWIAKHRQKLAKGFCYIPSIEERQRFL